MKRRQFIQSLAIAPAAATAALTPAPPAQAGTPAVPSAQGRGGGRGTIQPPPEVDPLTYAVADNTTNALPVVLGAGQMLALKRLGRLFVPGTPGAPGAEACHAAEFLDFLCSHAADRQALYKSGLDTLNAQAKQRFGASFGDTTDVQADALMDPMRRPWSFKPADPLERFLRQANRDLRAATQNSREYALGTGTPRTVRWLRPLD